MTDPEKILAALDQLNDNMIGLNDRLDRQAQGINSIGENVQWLVSNTQGLFQMFSNPMMIQQLMGGMTNGGPQIPDIGDESGESSGADS